MPIARLLNEAYLNPELLPGEDSGEGPYRTCQFCDSKAVDSLVVRTNDGPRWLDLCQGHLEEVVDVARAAGLIS